MISQTLSVCTVSESGSGVWSLSLLTSGSCSLLASQSGNADYGPAWSGQTFWVGRTAQTITFPYVPSVQATVALENIALTATASSGLPVSYITQTPLVCGVSQTGSIWYVNLLTSGSCSLLASQAGNSIYGAAASSGQTFWVGRAAQTITFPYVPSVQATVALENIALTATASSGLPVSYITQTPLVCGVSQTGSIWYVNLLTSGSCSLLASQAGNSIYGAAASSGQTFWVGRAAQTITFPYVPSVQATVALENIALTATASSGLPVSYITQTPAICGVSQTGSIWYVNLLTSGSCSLLASQAGNSIYGAAASSDQTFWVGRTAQTITFPAVGTQTAGTSVLLPATASSTLAVSYTSTTPAVCTIDATGTNAVLVAAGKCTIQANQAGNAVYSAAPTVTQSFTVNAQPTVD